MKTMISLVSALILVGCATTSTEGSLELEAIRATLTEMKAENAALKKMVAEKDIMTKDAKAAQKPQSRPTVVMAPPMVDQVPPANPLPPGPPQYWAWMHNKPLGCKNGPFALNIRNSHYDLYFVLWIDGEEVVIGGAGGNLTVPNSTRTPMPPESDIYLCLKSIGEHTISGVAYAPDIVGQLVEVKRFHTTTSFGLQYGTGGQHFTINDRTIR